MRYFLVLFITSALLITPAAGEERKGLLNFGDTLKKEEKKEEDEEKRKSVETTGDMWVLEASEQNRINENTFEASGYVNFTHAQVQVQADYIRFNAETGELRAEGNVVISEKEGRRVTGQLVEMNMNTGLATLYDATAFDEPSYFFTGDRIEKVGDDRYIIHGGEFTTCNQPRPYWSFKSKKTKARIGGYARFRHLRMKVKGVPVLYSPYLIWPIKQDRTSGFLIPDVGYSRLKGAMISSSFFWAVSRNADATVKADYWAKDGMGLGGEFRYKFRSAAEGELSGYFIDQETAARRRYTGDYKHKQDLFLGLRGAVKASYVSDLGYYRSFENSFDMNARTTVRSEAYATGNWGYNSLNVIVEQEEYYSTLDDTTKLRRLPEIEFRGRRRRLGGLPLYMSFDSSAININKESDTLDYKYQRYDLSPSLSLPLTPVPWLDLEPSADYRVTYYTKRLDGGTGELSDESFTRDYYRGAFQFTGPRFYRVFDRERENRFFSKFKHTIEPRVKYEYREDLDENPVPLFDERDRVSGSLNRLTYSLWNRFYGKPTSERLSPYELFSLELQQSYSFDRPLSRDPNGEIRYYSPVSGHFRYYPLPEIGGDLRTTYDVLNGEFSSAGISARFSRNEFMEGEIIWNITRNPLKAETTGQQVRTKLGFNFFREKIDFDIEINYDVERDIFQNQRYRFSYKGQCAGMVLEFVKKDLGGFEDEEIRFVIELKDVGKLLDI